VFQSKLHYEKRRMTRIGEAAPGTLLLLPPLFHKITVSLNIFAFRLIIPI